MLFLVVSNKEVTKVKLKIKEVDPRAFVVVTDAYDTFGEGWKTLPSKDELQPEWPDNEKFCICKNKYLQKVMFYNIKSIIFASLNF